MATKTETTFDAHKYVCELWTYIDTDKGPWHTNAVNRVPKLRPVTLADHIAAEAEARQQAEARINSGPDYDQMPDLDELDGVTVKGSTIELLSYASDVELDCWVWEYCAKQLLDFQAAIAKEVMVADFAHAKRTKVIKAFFKKRKAA